MHELFVAKKKEKRRKQLFEMKSTTAVKIHIHFLNRYSTDVCIVASVPKDLQFGIMDFYID